MAANQHPQKPDEVLKHLMESVFEKAKKESGKDTAYGLSKYLNDVFEDSIDERSLTRYYNGYLLGRDSERTHPDEYVQNTLSSYVGFDNFQAFEKAFYVANENLEVKRELRTTKQKLKRIKIMGTSFSLLFLVLAIVFISKYYTKNCMIWVEDHYEKIRCSGLDNETELDEVVLKNFKKVEVCKDSFFFENGKARIHYIRHDNTIDFFTSSGEHPILKGKFTNPITQTIIESRVKDCDSI
ncbi:MAG: hypothetical protein KDD16_11750 [Mangrovimonas sp.]|nr:hypothetical protein [Mangrovimonas sp.]